MKKNALLILFFLLLCIGGIVIILFLSNVITMFRSVSYQSNFSPVIVLDPGHGGFDCGAIGPGNVLEKDINLSISLKLKDILVINGYTVKMTRTTDAGTESPDAKTIRQKKNTDIKNRMKIIDQNAGGLFVSIHQNMFTESQYYGSQVFYSGNNEGSKILADYLQKQLVSLLQPENKRLTKRATNDIYLLYNANKETPAIMVECGFLSNKQEAEKLVNEEYQKKLAFAIFSGITLFLYGNEE